VGMGISRWDLGVSEWDLRVGFGVPGWVLGRIWWEWGSLSGNRRPWVRFRGP